MCSQTSPPRLSFSHDPSELQPMKHHVPRRRDDDDDETSLMMMMDSNNNNSEFEFSISRSSQEFVSSSADELFSNGVILPMQIQNQNKPITSKKHTRLPPRPSCPSSTIDKAIKEPCNSMSFWGFGRSKSLNCGDTKKSLNFSSSSSLPRSNSTGSVKNPKRSTSYGGSSSSSYPVQKSGSGKGYGGGSYYGNGLRVSPVLNVPTPYIPKGTSNFFSFGSILRVGKAKKSKN